MLRLFSALLGPMFAKELIEVSRRKRYFMNRLIYGSALLLVLLVVWEKYSRFNFDSSSQDALLQHMAEMAGNMFTGASWVQILAVYLFVPVFVSGVIAGEREAGTLDLLLTTQLADREIVLAKLGSRLLVMMALVISALPVLSLVMLFGGIAPEGLWRTQAATLLSVLFAGSVAIYFSSISRSPLGALVRTYWWLGVWLLFMPYVTIWLADELIGGSADDVAAAVIALVNPGVPFLAAVEPSTYNHFSRLLGTWFFPASFVLPLAASVFLIARATSCLRLPPPFWTRWRRLAQPIQLALRWYRGFAEERAVRRRQRAERTRWGTAVENPLWMRSRRTAVYDREGHIGRMVLGGWAIALGSLALLTLFDPQDLDDEESSMGFVGLAWTGVLLLIIVVAASSVVGDRRRGLLELMLVTPLSSREFVDGTLLGVGRHLRAAWLLPWTLTALFVLTGATHPLGGFCSLITATLFCANVLVLGVLCSLVARHPAAALAPTFGFAAITIVGGFLAIVVLNDNNWLAMLLLPAILLPVSIYWTGRSTSAVSVAVRFFAMYLLFCALATFWTAVAQSLEHPMADIHPWYLTMVFLQKQSPFSSTREPDGYTLAALPLYWIALMGTFAWTRGWMIRNFDRLAGRATLAERPGMSRPGRQPAAESEPKEAAVAIS